MPSRFSVGAFPGWRTRKRGSRPAPNGGAHLASAPVARGDALRRRTPLRGRLPADAAPRPSRRWRQSSEVAAAQGLEPTRSRSALAFPHGLLPDGGEDTPTDGWWLAILRQVRRRRDYRPCSPAPRRQPSVAHLSAPTVTSGCRPTANVHSCSRRHTPPSLGAPSGGSTTWSNPTCAHGCEPRHLHDLSLGFFFSLSLSPHYLFSTVHYLSLTPPRTALLRCLLGRGRYGAVLFSSLPLQNYSHIQNAENALQSVIAVNPEILSRIPRLCPQTT